MASKSRGIQRFARANALQAVVDPWAQVRRLNAENEILRGRVADLAGQLKIAKQLLSDDDGKSRIEIHVNDNVPSNTVMVTREDHNNRVGEMKRHQSRVVQLTFSIGELRRLTERVDLLTIHGNRTELAQNVAGYDSQLMKIMQDIRRLAHTAHYQSPALTEVAHLAQLRVNAIMEIDRDNGRSLLKVVAETSVDFADKAKALQEKLQNGATQGRHVDPITQRVYEYALQFKYGDTKRTWDEAGHACLDDLFKRGASLDGVDQNIYRELTEIRKTDEARGQWMHSKYHSRKRQLESV